jgi:hypothetical protein
MRARSACLSRFSYAPKIRTGNSDLPLQANTINPFALPPATGFLLKSCARRSTSIRKQMNIPRNRDFGVLGSVGVE